MTDVAKKRWIFWIRLISWLAIGCGTPIGVFAYKFGLFKKTIAEYDELGNLLTEEVVALNGWGIISVLLIGTFAASILKEIAESKKGYSLLKQVYMGLSKTVPLIITYAILYFLNGVIEKVMFCLIILIICRIVSIPLNPLPKWKYEKRGEEDYSTLAEALAEFLKKYTRKEGT